MPFNRSRVVTVGQPAKVNAIMSPCLAGYFVTVQVNLEAVGGRITTGQIVPRDRGNISSFSGFYSLQLPAVMASDDYMHGYTINAIKRPAGSLRPASRFGLFNV